MSTDQNSAETEVASAASEFWDKTAANQAEIFGRIWTAHPKVRARINKLVSGDETQDWFAFGAEKLKAAGVTFPVDRMASFGCGTGSLERGVAGMGIAREICGYDVSPQSIDIARQEADAISTARLVYSVADLNREAFGENQFEIAVVNMALHHIEQLEFFTQALHRALKPGGWLIINEYVGATRFQWPDPHIDLMNQILDRLPHRWRRQIDNQIRAGVARPTIEQMIEVDPSEAVRSEEIMGALSKHFDVVELRNYGGSLLQIALSEIVQNFTGEDGEAFLNLIFLIEDVAMQGGLIASDFCTAILRAK